jgi:acetylornithine deacetylase
LDHEHEKALHPIMSASNPVSPSSLSILEKLIGYDTTSSRSNLELISYAKELLEARGITCTVVSSEDGTKANLFAHVGPTGVPGILLSGHTDVVPVANQKWASPPFEATLKDGRVYGRGACDMKGFIACALLTMLSAKDKHLLRPLQLALSYDEEVGCIGVRRLLDHLHAGSIKPLLCVVGEPTQMKLVLGHKGKSSLTAQCHGHEAHSSQAPSFPNAIHLASALVEKLRHAQEEIQRSGAYDGAFDVPFSTVHVGTIHGGTALNIVPNLCSIEFEVRDLPGDNITNIIDGIRADASDIGKAFSQPGKPALIEINESNYYPPLDTSPTIDAVNFLGSLLPVSDVAGKVAYGTEGGLFSRRLDTPVAVCGPGSIDQAHKPDEYVTLEQLEACEQFLLRVLQSLSS